jgi:peptidoglycan-associated lipoprotein
MVSFALRIIALLVVLGGCGSTPEESSLDTAGAAGVGAGAGADGGTGPGGDVSSTQLGTAQPGSQQDLEVNVGDRVFFGYDSSTLDDTARQTLDRQAAWLQQFPAVAVSIEGHTDERGTRDYNLALGERRAAAVRDYLVALGVLSERLQTISYGEERPVDPGHDESAYALNRRAVSTVAVTQ